MIKEAALRLAPDLPISISSEVLPEIKEYERTSSTVINAYLTPIVGRYVARLEGDLSAKGVRAPLLIMQSNGGLMSAAAAAHKPMHIVESGPAAGVVGAQVAGARRRHRPPDQLRHGRHHGQGRHHRARRVLTGARVPGRRRHHDRLAAADRRGLPPQGAGDRSRRGRRRRRLARANRFGRLDDRRPRQRRRRAGAGLLRYRRRRADRHRRKPDPGPPEPRFPGRRCSEAECRARAKNLRRADRGAARPVARACRLRRAAHRQRQHDARDPRGLDRARSRRARLHLVRVRRQRPGVRLHDGEGARHAPRPGAAVARPVLGLRPALRRGRAPLWAQLPPPAAQPRPRPPERRLGCHGAGGARRARGRGFCRRSRRHPAAWRACTTRARPSISPCRCRTARSGRPRSRRSRRLSGASTSAPMAIAPARTSRSS